MGSDQSDDHGQDGLIISRILAGTARDFVQAKCSLVLVDREVWQAEKKKCKFILYFFAHQKINEIKSKNISGHLQFSHLIKR